MNKFIILPIDLRLFDEGAGAEGGTTGGQSVAQTDDSGDLSKIKFGKQEAQEQKPAKAEGEDGGSAAGSVEAQTQGAEDISAEFKALIAKGGKYAEPFRKEFQRIFDDRHKDAKGTAEKLKKVQPLLDTLAAKYGLQEADPDKLSEEIDRDKAFWEAAAEKAGYDNVEAYRKAVKLQNENARLARAVEERDTEQRQIRQIQDWAAGAQELLSSGDYEFDVLTELKNPDVRRLLMAGIPFRTAYETAHLDDIKTTVAKNTAASTEKRMADNVRAKGSRPKENGANSSAGVSFNPADPSTWSDGQFKEVLRRVKAGEEIKL